MDALFYDKNKKEIKYKVGNRYDRGYCGSIYLLDKNTCLKWFGDDNFYDAEAFEIIMNLHLKGFYEIYQMLFDNRHKFRGYTMKYYRAQTIDIMTMPMEYTIMNFLTLYESIMEITKNDIFVRDLREDNVIKNENGITVIDADLYFKNLFYSVRNDLTRDELYYNNIKELYNLFSEIYLNSLGENHYTQNYDKLIIDELFSYDSSPQIITKKLSRYRRPLDYMNAYR